MMASTPTQPRAQPHDSSRGPIVGLSLDELTVAATLGVARNVSMIERRRGRGHDAVKNAWEANGVGMIGEYAVAKLLGVAYNPSLSHPDRLGGDVAGLQVRATSYPDGSPKI